MVLDEMISLFLDSRKRGSAGARRECSKKTLEYYERNLTIWKNYFMEEKSATRYESIRRLDMKAFLDWLDAKVSAGEWSKATKIGMLGALRTLFRWVEKDEDCQLAELKSYCRWLPPIGKKPRRLDIPATVDMKKFKNGFNTNDKWEYRDYVLTCLLIDTGVRAGEAANLRLDGVRFDERILFVTGKTGPRTVPVTRDMVRIMKGWLKRRESCRYAHGSPYFFVSKRSPQLDVDAIGHSFRKHVAKLGLPRISAHTFRHAYATNYLGQGGNMENLRINMGHSSYEMLKEYLHLAMQGSKSSQDELEKVSLLKRV